MLASCLYHLDLWDRERGSMGHDMLARMDWSCVYYIVGAMGVLVMGNSENVYTLPLIRLMYTTMIGAST